MLNNNSKEKVIHSTFEQVEENQHIEISRLLKNTYMLLSMTLLFSAATAWLAMFLGIGHGASLVCSISALVMLFVVHKTANSAKGLISVFIFTGLLGAALGPILQHYLGLANGPTIVTQALGGTAVVFLSLSCYVLTTKKDFSFLGGFLMVGLVVAVLSSLVLLFFHAPVAQLALSAMIVLLMSGLILYDTSRIIHGGETNYILATVALYLDIYNLFTALLHLLGVGED